MSKIKFIIDRAERMGRIKDGLVLCDNCDTPASKSLALKLRWTPCAPCVWGQADSFDDNDLIHVPIGERPDSADAKDAGCVAKREGD